MLFFNNKVVFKTKTDKLEHKNVKYFIKKYDSNCSICLSFPKDSVIINCNHVFCSECLMEMIEFFTKCPVCSFSFKDVYKVKLILLDDVREYICFKRIQSFKNVNYFDFPYLSIYYENSFSIKIDNLIYQSFDGQPYFLNEKMTNKFRSKNKQLPDFIYAKIIKIQPVKVKHKEQSYLFFKHFLEDSIIYIVDIETYY